MKNKNSACKVSSGKLVKQIGIVVILCLATISVSFAKATKIKGTLTNAENGKYFYLFEMLGTEFQKLDSAEIKKNSVQFKRDLVRGYYKMGISTNDLVDIILGNENINFTADAKDLKGSIKVTDSKEWNLLQQFNQFNQDYQTKMKDIQADINLARQMNMKDPEKAQEIFDGSKERFEVIAGSRKEMYSKMSSENPESFMGKVAGFYLKVDEFDKNDFFKRDEISDPEMQKGEMWVALMSTYFQKFLLTSRVDNLDFSRNKIKNHKEGTRERELMYISLIRNLMVVDQQAASSLGKDYKEEYPSSKFQKGLVKLLPPLPVAVGDMAPDIVEKSPDGDEMKLSDTRGNIVLIDFWASWCGPCRRENPNVVKAYNKYKDKGFTIFSVSLDKDARRWKGAIERDGLIWPTHVSDLKGWSADAAKLYGVNSIPTTFLVDRDGKIIAKNLRGHSLERKLAKLLDK